MNCNRNEVAFIELIPKRCSEIQDQIWPQI